MSELLTILQGDATEQLRTLEAGSVQCCVTSPPYWGLRDYGFCSCRKHRIQHDSSTLAGTQAGTQAGTPNHVGPPREDCPLCNGSGRIAGTEVQIGLEKTPADYVNRLVSLFSEVRRVLRADGTLWLNLGDSYYNYRPGKGQRVTKQTLQEGNGSSDFENCARRGNRQEGLKEKDLVGIPWMMAFALRDVGWYLRSEITWCKKVPMPESVNDRPTSATEKIFLFSKSAKYFYDADAVRNPPSEAYANDSRWQTGSTDRNEKNGYAEAGAQNPKKLHKVFDKQRGHSRRHAGFNDRWDAMEKSEQCVNGSNMRNYWLLGPEPFPESHFATFPTEVPKKCILAGSKTGDTILDPFAGSGTTGMVAIELGRKAILIELNPEYIKLIKQRCTVTPGLALGSGVPTGKARTP